MFREVLGVDLLSMTLMPEVVLARELGMCYATCAVVTDLDVWGKEAVQAVEVNRVMEENAPKLAELLQGFAAHIPELQGCACSQGNNSLPQRNHGSLILR